jgi:FkbM family methyltransferase
MKVFDVSFFRKVSRRIMRILLTPKLPKFSASHIVKLGSNYGSKYVVDQPALHDSVLISGGCGEDISFDIEFAKTFNARVVMIDPIPRSQMHFEQVIQRIGQPAIEPYSSSGKQPITAYDLEGIKPDQLEFLPKAFWDKDQILTLFAPRNPNHVSYSFMDLQGTKSAGEQIDVTTVTISEIVKLIAPARVEVIKLDIEGAQLEVIRDCFNQKVFPSQIIVEIDELFFPTIKGRKRAKVLLKLLKGNGYVPVAAHEKFDITFLRK